MRQSALELSELFKMLMMGSVLIYARGEEQKMAAFLEWCKKGPAFAMVTGLELAEIADKGWKDFQIVRSSR
jgi:acylphosphatase